MGKIFLLIKELFGNVFINFIVFLVILFASFLTSTFVFVLLNVDNYFNRNFVKSIPPDVIKVTPKTYVATLNIFGLTSRKPKGSYIDDDILNKVRKLDGVVEVEPLLVSRIPMQVFVSIFGIKYGSDLICIGVNYDLIAGDIKDRRVKRMWNNWKTGDDIPVVIPEILYHAYNSSIAEPNSLPKVTREMVLGVKLRINFGKSSLKSYADTVSENGVVVGFTDKVANICLVLPIKVMRYYNEKFNAHSEYIHLYVKTKDHNSLLSVSKKLKSMGFVVETDKNISEEILKLKKILGFVGNMLILVIVIMAVTSIGFSSIVAVSSRYEYYKTLRILGASRFFIAFSIVFKFALIGLISGLLSLFIFERGISFIISSLPLKGYFGIFSLGKKYNDLILLGCVFLPMVFSLLGVLMLYDHHKLLVD
jgi:cell division protein FtsX